MDGDAELTDADEDSNDDEEDDGATRPGELIDDDGDEGWMSSAS